MKRALCHSDMTGIGVHLDWNCIRKHEVDGTVSD